MQAGCIQSIIADEMLKAPNPQASSFTQKLENHEDVSADLPFLFDSAYTVKVGPPTAIMTYFVVEPKPNFYYVHGDYSLHDDTQWKADIAKYDVYPIATQHRTISNHILPHQLCMTIAYPAVDKTILHEEFIKKPRGTIILLEGHSGYTRKQPYLWPIAAVLSNHGYRVIMPDLRGQGDSTGEHISYGKYETKDLKQLVDVLAKRGLIEGNLGIVGHSYGSMMSIFAASNDPRIKAVASISPNNRMIDPTAIMNIAKLFHPDIYKTIQSLGGKPLLKTGIREAAERLQVNPDTFCPAQALTHIKTPLLLMHGTADQICPPYASKEIQDARPQNTTRITFPDDDHWSLLYKGKLWPSLVTFFDTNLNPTEPPRTHTIADLHYKPMPNPSNTAIAMNE